MDRYLRTHGKENVARILAAVKASGGVVVSPPNPSSAPYELVVRTARGIKLDLVCYAFTANEYLQKNRPKGEHRFQIKYGGEFSRLHPIFVDDTRNRITLMLGCHDDLRVFVAVDPSMHNPTWFSRSVEFKKNSLDAGLKTGWFGWERERRAGGRRKLLPQEDSRTEILSAFSPDRFLDFACFERIATGMDPGERLRLFEQIGHASTKPFRRDRLLAWPAAGPTTVRHPLLEQFELTADELLDVLASRFRLLSAVRGGVAEMHLERLLKAVPGIKRLQRIDADGKPDFDLMYKGRRIRVECKNVLRRSPGGLARVDFQKTRAAKSDPCSRYYRADQFEILAACLHPLTDKWEYRFCLTRMLSPHKTCKERLSDKVVVDKNWHEDIRLALQEVGP